MHILDSPLAFSAYFFIGVAMAIIFLFTYSKVTPRSGWRLVKNNSTAASLMFSSTLLGYVIPLSSAAINAVGIPDYFAWGGTALAIQLLVFTGVRLYMPTLNEKIIDHNTAAGMFMGTTALADDIFNAACVIWQWTIMTRKRKSKNNSRIGHGAVSRTGRPNNPFEPCRNRYAQKYLALTLMSGAAFFVLKGCSDSSDVDGDGDGTFYTTVQDYIDDDNDADICARGWNNTKATFYADVPRSMTQQNCQSKYENCCYDNVGQSWIPVVSGFLLSRVIRKDRDEPFVCNSGGSSSASYPVQRSTSGGYSWRSGSGKKESYSSDGFTAKKASTVSRGGYNRPPSTRGHWGG